MRTTLELPDPLFRQVKADAARRGMSLKQWLGEAVDQHLHQPDPGAESDAKPWRGHLGKLSKADAAHLRRFVDAAAFSQVDPEDQP